VIEINQLLYKTASQIAQENNKFAHYGNKLIDSTKNQWNNAKIDWKTLLKNLKDPSGGPGLGFMGGNAFTSFPSAVGGAVGGWVELDRTTLGSGSENITVSSLANKRYYMILSSVVGAASAAFNYAMMGNGSIDTGSNWAYRYSRNGAADVTAVSTTDNYLGNASTTLPTFNVTYIANLSAKEKLIQNQFVGQNTATASNAPNRSEQVSKWVNTSNPLDIFALKSLSPNFDTGSEVVVLEWDPADVHTNNFWEELFSEQLVSDNQNFSTGTIPAKKYLWLQFYQVGMTGDSIWRFNGDSTTSYSRRHEINGAADATVISQTSLINVLTGGTAIRQDFTNVFIVNNSANEKLIIYNNVFGTTTGAGNAPSKILGVCKWDDVAAQITSMTVDDSGAGFDTGSFLKIWGSD